MVRQNILFGPILQALLEVVVLRHLSNSLQVLLQYLLLLSHLGKSMTHLIKQIAKTNHSFIGLNHTCDLDEDDHDDLSWIFWCDVSVADGQHGCAGEIKRIEVFLKDGSLVDSKSSCPVTLRVDLGRTEDENRLNSSMMYKEMGLDENVGQEIQNLELVLILQGKRF